MMFHKINDIEGFGPDFADKLRSTGIVTTEDLLERGRDSADRARLAGVTAISEALLTKWVAMSDLMRVKGLSKPYCDLLLLSGIDSTEKMLTFQPRELIRLMEEQIRIKSLDPDVPKLADVEQWLNELRSPEFAPAK